jgi:hypothetical protein
MPVQAITAPESVNEKLLPMNSVLKQSYDHARKHIQDGVTVIQDSISVIKDEFIGMYDKAATMVNKMALPVNNFLKDLTQIEAEFQAELAGTHSGMTRSSCNIIPLEEALKGRMEENY